MGIARLPVPVGHRHPGCHLPLQGPPGDLLSVLDAALAPHCTTQSGTLSAMNAKRCVEVMGNRWAMTGADTDRTASPSHLIPQPVTCQPVAD